MENYSDMELFVHIGTNKTGSSFLQSSLILNRKFLENNGYYLASSKWDQEMLESKITPGNGHQFAVCLAEENEVKLKEYLGTLLKEARNKKLRRIILSNEILIRLFSNAHILELLKKVCNHFDLRMVNFLVIIRNPYEHALSLYKHRAKYGEHGDYSTWFEEDYETLRLFKPFLNHYNLFGINFHFRVYQKNSDFLLKVLYEDFLKCNIPSVLPSKEVNASMSLNQIRVLQHLVKSYPGIEAYLYNALMSLPKKDSTENPELKGQFFTVAKEYFRSYNLCLEQLSELLPPDERGTFMQTPSFEFFGTLEESKYLLTEAELNVILSSIAQRQKNRFKDKWRLRYRVWRQRSKPVVFNNKLYGGSLR